MDRLVNVDVEELGIVYKPDQRCSSQTFRISNLMHTMPVAVSLSLSHSSLFSLKPPTPLSIIPPLSSLSFSLLLLQSPPPPLPPPSLTILSALLPTGKADPPALQRLFSLPSRHIFSDAVLPIFFLGPHFLFPLLSSSSSSPLSPSLLLRALSHCSSSDLSSLLLSAASSRPPNPSLISALLHAGADPNTRSPGNSSPLSLAAYAGCPEALAPLLAAGARYDPSLDTFLLDLADSNRLDLIALVADSCGRACLRAPDPRGRTPAHAAAARGHVAVVRFCIAAGCDPTLPDARGLTPLHCAAAEGRLDAARLLLNSAAYTKYAVDGDGKTPFSLAFEAGHFHLLEDLQLGDDLHRAAGLGDIDRLSMCLEQGVDVNVRDQNGWTALHRAAFKGMMESAEFLLSHGAQPDLVDDAGYTPLHCAAEAGHSAIAVCLVAHKACFNLKTLKLGGTGPLDLPLLTNSASLVVPVPVCGESE